MAEAVAQNEVESGKLRQLYLSRGWAEIFIKKYLGARKYEIAEDCLFRV
jgi:hypothetical protein